MLKFIFGRSGSGKTEYVLNEIETKIKNGHSGLMLLCPEQFSFNFESKLLKRLGEQNFHNVECMSMSRLCNEAKSLYDTSSLPVLTRGGKAILMKKAIDKSADELNVFEKKSGCISFVTAMTNIYDEMKSCNLSGKQIVDMSQSIDKVLLSNKLHDIGIIIDNYDSSITNRFSDPANELSALYKTLYANDYFKGKIVYIDGFNGFVAQEYKIIELIIGQAKSVVITLDTDRDCQNRNDELFAYVNNTVDIITKIAQKLNVDIESLSLTHNYRAINNDLRHFEKNIYDDNQQIFEGKCENIELYSSSSVTDECAAVSRKIKRLLRQGYRARDIAVITRDISKYSSTLEANFKKYEVPYYIDERQPIKNQPIIVFCEYLLRIVNYSFRSEDILGLAKTGLTQLTDEEISKLENYVYIWSISGSKWKNEFDKSTRGFAPEITDADKQQLDAINESRKCLISPICCFASAVKNAGAKTICEAVYNALIQFKANTALEENARFLMHNGQSVLAMEQGAAWDSLMNTLSQMANILGDEPIRIKEFASLFSLMIGCDDYGTIPSGIDNVQYGQADRIRTDNPRAVFIIGANEGEFPQNVSIKGLITDSERKTLAEHDFKLYSYGEVLNLQERYFAYKACSAPSEKLFISYCGNTGRETAPSSVVTSVREIFGDIVEENSGNADPMELIESKASAFEIMADRFSCNTEFYNSLKKYFESDTRFEAVKRLASNEQYEIKNKAAAKELFNNDIRVSVSKIEDFYNCKFRYFCKFGLNAKAVYKAELNPMERGTLIHYVLEHALADIGCKALSNMPYNEIDNAVQKYIHKYFTEEMGNIADATERFMYNFNRLSKLIVSVLYRLGDEFAHCNFEAKAFELPIDDDGEIKPEIINLDDGGTISIRGSIDRVDIVTKNNTSYVRVVDYKSGRKTFNLNDVICGLNLQMFVYLFNLCSNKNSHLSGIPAGVLYLHSSRSVVSIDNRYNQQSSIKAAQDKEYRADGVVLSDSDIITEMDDTLKDESAVSIYIPVAKKNGDISGSVATLEELGLLHKKINSLIREMGQQLHSGSISQNPVFSSNHKNTCEYCDYKRICLMTPSVTQRECDDLTDNEVKALLKEGDANGKEMD